MAVAPIPFGSTSPLFGFLLAGCVGALALAYGFAIRFDAASVRFPVSRVRLGASLMLATLIMLGVQLLPLSFAADENTRLAAEALGVPVTARISVDPAATLLQAVRYGAYGLFTFLCLQVAARLGRARIFLEALFWIAVAHGLWALASLYALDDSFLGVPKWFVQGFATGTFFSRNTLATFMTLGAVAGTGLLALAITDRAGERLRFDAAPVILLYLCGIGILAAATFASVSRMGIVLVILGPSIVLAALIARTLQGLASRLVALAAFGGIVAIITLVYADRLILRVGSVDRDGEVRWAAVLQTYDLALQRPLIGWGGGSFPTAFPLVRQPEVGVNTNWTYAHNLYVELWSDLGFIVGSFPVLAVLALAARCCVGAVRNRTRWPYAVTALAAVLVAGVHSAVDFSLQVPSVVLFFLALLAIGTAQSDRPVANAST